MIGVRGRWNYNRPVAHGPHALGRLPARHHGIVMTNHRVLSPSDYRRMPWKNGGGHTHEIAAHPEGAGMAAFAWRVSIAEIAQDGPFSSFPGVDRTLVLLAGNGGRPGG